jgi:hypothetical protein
MNPIERAERLHTYAFQSTLTLLKSAAAVAALGVAILLAGTARAQDDSIRLDVPGTAINPVGGVAHDQKAGSVLIYPVYTSLASFSNLQNTRITMTNIDTRNGVFVHLFFVDGSTCSVGDSYLCLTPNQTSSFVMSDLDPGISGYLVAVAVNSVGCPIYFNGLIGDAYVKFNTGHAANLGAIAVGGLPGLRELACDNTTITTSLNFDGISYNPLPRTVAADNLPDRASNNDTLLVLNRIGGNLATGAATLGSLFGLLYDDSETGVSFSFTPGTCQFRSSLSNNFPRTTPRYSNLIPAGRSGWMKLWMFSEGALLGSTINFNPNPTTASGAFNQGHNLHTLTLTTSASYTIPVFPPSC